MRLSIDAGGTYFRYTLDGAQIQSESSIGITLESWLEAKLKQYPQIKTIGIGYAGQVKDGVIKAAPNMTIGMHDIKNHFESHYGVELFIQNDLECAILAEADYFQSKNICALYLGSGMGLGVISEGKLLQGHSGVAAELGHIPYQKSPFICGCGKDNCIELFASGTGLIKWKKHLGLDESLSLGALRQSGSELYSQFEDALMSAIGTLITIFNPQILVLGGGIFASDEKLFERVLQRYKQYSMPISAQEINIVKTQIENAVLKGATMLKENR